MISNTLLKRIGLHVLFWITILIYSTYLFGYPDHIKATFVKILLGYPVDLIYVYTILYYLIPKFLINKKYVLFVTLFIILGLLDELINRTLFYFIYFPEEYSGQVFLSYTELLNYFAYYYYAILAVAIKVIRIYIKKNKETTRITKEKYQAELKLKEAELKLLKAQIHPHFLFNTLNNLYGLTLEKSDKAPEVVTKLSDLLDYVLYKCNSSTVSLTSEIDHIHNYIKLEQLRYDESLTINVDRKGNQENIYIAPLLLLPFIENCFKHGVSKTADKSWIKISFEIIDNKLIFKAKNSKKDIPAPTNLKYSEGVGLKNVKQRLDLAYKDKHNIEIQDGGRFFSVLLDIEL